MEIQINKLSIEDLNTRVEWINHPSISGNMYFELPASYEKTLKWFLQLDSRPNRIDLVAKSHTEILSMFGLTDIDLTNSKAELYIMTNPKFQGMGIGQKATKWLLNYSFSILSLNKIYLYTDTKNLAASNMYNKVGFFQEGILRSDKFKNGVLNDRIVMSMLRKEWEDQSWKNNSLTFSINDN